MRNAFLKLCCLFAACFYAVVCFAQPNSTIELDKPEKYEKRTLGSEKTGTKKFTPAKHLYQNTVTHFNYYFNANNRLNDIVDRAKQSFKDDYTKLLPFYNYNLDVTAVDGDIDSIIYKCTAGILLHDLRNDWIDDMYLLMGKAYFYRKNFDSAQSVFAYINYAFAPKEKDGYDIPIGSNASNNSGIFSVATKEDLSFWKKLTGKPPSRNEALLWEAKDFMETGNIGEAAGLLQILKSDAQFPERLQPQLHELMSYWYYKQQVYDSAASHLSLALDAANTKEERARWEFLIAQMYLLANNNDKAIDFYNKSSEHTINPVMEVYANLNSIEAYSGNVENILQQKLDALLKMGHRDKFVDNRDIIYYAAAQIALQMNNAKAAEQLLLKSTTSSVNNPEQKSKSFILLGDTYFKDKQYKLAKNAYDSVDASNITDDSLKNAFTDRTAALQVITDNYSVINKEDSMQAIAKLPQAQRDAAIKKMVRQLRKAQGLKDSTGSDLAMNPAVNVTNAPDLFNPPNGIGRNATKDWYFNNQSLKGQGYTEFRQKWGARPNIDNWRRQSDIAKANSSSNDDNDNADNDNTSDSTNATATNNNGAPLLGKDGLPAEITFDALLEMLPTTDEKLETSNDNIAKALFTNGQTFQDALLDYSAAINEYDSLNLRFAQSNYKEQSLFNLFYCYNKLGIKYSADSAKNVLLNKYPDGDWAKRLKNPVPVAKETTPDAATLKYQDIYNMFIEGKFAEAETAKAAADSMYGNSYWTPQLLYIEAIYYVSQKQDSVAIDKLTSLTNQFASTPLAEKATTMIDVLGRRNEIETYLTQLQITRYKDDETHLITLDNPTPTIQKVDTRIDSTVSKPVTQVAIPKVDTAKAANVILKHYEFIATDSQYVTILLDNVAPVYANEARNAFNRYNQANYYTQKITITNFRLDDQHNILLIGPFPGASEALTYVDKTRPITGSRIVPWLAANKYTYSIISNANLSLLNETKDLEGYKQLLNKVLPGKF